MSVSREAFSIGDFPIYWYGIIISASILLDFILVFFLCKRKGFDRDTPYDLLLATVPAGVVVGRLFSVLFDSDLSILDYFDFRGGGMSILGALVGGLISLGIYALIKKKNYLDLLDIIAPLVLLAQGIGRWGNFFNQEVYGQEILNPNRQWFPLAVYIDHEGGFFQALFFYESVLNLIGFALLITLLYTIKNKKGVVVSTYLIFYGGVRFFLEGLRQPQFVLEMFGLPISKVISAVMVFVGVALLIYTLFFQGKIKTKKSVGKKVHDNQKSN